MKIAMVGQFPPHVGGVGVHIHTLSKELVKQGHEVYVITYPHKDIEDTKKVVAEYVNDSSKDNYYHWCIVLKETNEAVGSIGAFRLYDDLKLFEIGYCIGKKFWNKGITTEATKALIKFFFEEVGVNRIEARHDTKNPASGRVMIKSGLKFEGILRQAGKNNTGITDSAVYAILREEW